MPEVFKYQDKILKQRLTEAEIPYRINNLINTRLNIQLKN